ncbi:MAG: hypothetical protein O6952_07740, partial [Planctomycetota bacterium]|nr:hypothetical protein [Planctomycetota bacterium]
TPLDTTAEDGWVIRQMELTDDFDAVYAKMMALGTNGGDEFVGEVLWDAVHWIDWSDDPDALRLIYVAGNESADQGVERRDFRDSARDALRRDIVVNTIFAGPRIQGIQQQWQEVARAGRGEYEAIDMAYGTQKIATPYDATLLLLNDEMNATYIPYGDKGAEGMERLLAQDLNALRVGAQCGSSRVAAKGCAIYRTSAWDLVDAVGQDGFSFERLETEDFPEALRPLTPQQRRSYVDGMSKVRESVQAEILEVDRDRKAYIKTERAKKREGRVAFDDAILKSVRAQAMKKRFSFPPELAPVSQAPDPSQNGFGPMIQANLAAFQAAVPAIRYRVGTYETSRLQFATILSERTDETIRYAAAGREFPSVVECEGHLIEVLRVEIRDLRIVRVAAGEGDPFPYSSARGGVSGWAPFSPRNLIGGFAFPDRATADRVADRLVEEPRRNQVSGSGAGRSSAKILEELQNEIRSIAESAARAFQDLVRNC